jgi:hypothetical protein
MVVIFDHPQAIFLEPLLASEPFLGFAAMAVQELTILHS